MHKCREGLVAKRKKAAEIWSLPFLFLITQLLHAKWVAFLDEDFTITDFSKFSLQQWNQSTSHMRLQAPATAEAENVEEMDSPKAMEEDQLREDATPSGEDEAQYEDDDAVPFHEPITKAKYIHLCDEVAQLPFEIGDHQREYWEE
jgi:hypothetical protein